MLTLGVAAAQEVKDPNLFGQDFRGGKVDQRFLQYFPADADVRTEPEGLLIRLPLDAGKPQSGGVETRFRVQGDCEITASYELLHVERPTEGFGSGVSLGVTVDTPNPTRALIECVERTDGLQYICQKVVRKGRGKPDRQMKRLPAQAPRGKLRLVRQGALVRFLAAANDSDEFARLHELELGTEDLLSVRVAAESHGSNVPVTVRVHDLEIRAPDVFTHALRQVQAEEEAKAERKHWPAVAAILAVLLALFAGAWLWRRPRRAGMAVVLVGVIGGSAIYANLALAVTNPEDYRFFPPFQPHVNENHNNALGYENFEIARALAAGRGFADPFGEGTGPTAWMPPVLPVIEAALLRAGGGDRNVVMAAVIVLQALALVGTGLLVLALVRDTAQGPGPWVVTGVFLVYVLADFRCWFQLTRDSWLVLLAVDLLVVGLCAWPAARGWAWSAGWGFFGGLAALVNPIVGFAWGVLSLPAAWRRSWPRLALAGFVAGLTVAPWVLRNYLVFGRLIPIKSNLAHELYQSQCLTSDGLVDRATFKLHPHGLAKRKEYQALGEMAFLDRKREQFRQAVCDDPGDFLRRLANRFLAATLWYQPWDCSPQAERPWVLWASRVLYPLPFLALLYLVFTGSEQLGRAQWAAVGVYLVYLLPYIAVSYYDRYAMPLLGVKVFLVVSAVGLHRARAGVAAKGARSASEG